MKTPTEIGALIRARRQLLNMDQAELAQRVGVSRLWVNQVERGKPGARIGLVLRTLTAVGVHLIWSEPANSPSQSPTPSGFSINDVIENAKRKPKR